MAPNKALATPHRFATTMARGARAPKHTTGSADRAEIWRLERCTECERPLTRGETLVTAGRRLAATMTTTTVAIAVPEPPARLPAVIRLLGRRTGFGRAASNSAPSSSRYGRSSARVAELEPGGVKVEVGQLRLPAGDYALTNLSGRAAWVADHTIFGKVMG